MIVSNNVVPKHPKLMEAMKELERLYKGMK